MLTAPKTFENRAIATPETTPGTVLVEPRAVGLCGSDLMAYRGSHPRMIPPLVLGHEFAGVVSAHAADVEGLPVGTRVAVNPVVSCGSCDRCTAGRDNLCAGYRVIGAREELPGALGQHVLVSAHRVLPIPESLSFESAAATQPLAVSHHAVVDRGSIAGDARVLVIGAGPIGLGAVLIGASLGAVVDVVDMVESRLATAHELGARTVAVPTGSTLPSAIDADAYDVVIEAVGGSQLSTLVSAQQAIRPGGRIVVVGNFAADVRAIDLAAMKTKEFGVIGSQSYSDRSYRDMLALVASGAVRAEAIISHRFGRSEAGAAFALLDDDQADKGKIIVECEAGDLSEAGA